MQTDADLSQMDRRIFDGKGQDDGTYREVECAACTAEMMMVMAVVMMMKFTTLL